MTYHTMSKPLPWSYIVLRMCESVKQFLFLTVTPGSKVYYCWFLNTLVISLLYSDGAIHAIYFYVQQCVL